jgi:GntR family transcriptional regulator
MYIVEGARERLLAAERERFLKEEWPQVLARIERLGLKTEQLMPNAKIQGERP